MADDNNSVVGELVAVHEKHNKEMKRIYEKHIAFLNEKIDELLQEKR